MMELNDKSGDHRSNKTNPALNKKVWTKLHDDPISRTIIKYRDISNGDLKQAQTRHHVWASCAFCLLVHYFKVCIRDGEETQILLSTENRDDKTKNNK